MNLSIEPLFHPFQRLEYPGDENISINSSIEGRNVALYFKGKSWTALNVNWMRKTYWSDPAACLSFMTDVAFRYYFPGYMRMALYEYDSADAIFDVVVTRILRAADSTEFRRIIEKYDADQLSAIAKFASIISEKFCRFYPSDEAQSALDKYWKQYL